MKNATLFETFIFFPSFHLYSRKGCLLKEGKGERVREAENGEDTGEEDEGVGGQGVGDRGGLLPSTPFLPLLP